ncbi:MAG: hypothetical protein D6743_10650 [Calditrichaeota bacterium]|nr:MAG: hypothetical protein D6743_10650 [Calditrichota bacterium]
MVLAAHPPCYLPSLPFFYKMGLADVFVLLDDYPYTTHGEINRTRIKTADGASWLTVPVRTRGRRGQLIRDVEIDTTRHWARRHGKTLQVNYIYAPYFDLLSEDLDAVYARNWHHLLDLNLELIRFARRVLELPARLKLSSELSVAAGPPAERLAGLLAETGCDVYLESASLRAHLVKKGYLGAGIRVEFVNFAQPRYHQQFGHFIPDLSVMDLLFNEGPESRDILEQAWK